MPSFSFPDRPRSGRFALIVAAALVAGFLAFAGAGGSPAGAADGPAQISAKKPVVLGAGGRMPAARCPQQCLAIAIVSGFQSKMNGLTSPFRVPFNGKITAWKLGLGKPDRFQRKFFTDRFGDRPSAGLAVLKKIRVKGKIRYMLLRRSPIQGLNRVLGTVASFKLDRPIKVAKGNLVALTVPTWAPAMAKSEAIRPGAESWRASRGRATCKKAIGPKTSRPQQGLRSKREYGCRFDGQRLLYRVKVAPR